jgi:hypothetical protein
MVLDIPLGLQIQNSIEKGMFLIGLLSSKPQCGYGRLEKGAVVSDALFGYPTRFSTKQTF